jgi:hypothetical protein
VVVWDKEESGDGGGFGECGDIGRLLRLGVVVI